MPRVKRGTKRRARRKKLLKHAKGFFLTKGKLFRSAKEAVNRSLRYSYRDRRTRKRRRVPRLRSRSTRDITTKARYRRGVAALQELQNLLHCKAALFEDVRQR